MPGVWDGDMSDAQHRRRSIEAREMRRCVVIGAFVGLCVGVFEAFITSRGAPDLLVRMSLHFGQFGFACPPLGGVLGYIVAKRIDRKRTRRRVEGHCCYCDYDLTGNESGICPECGERI